MKKVFFIILVSLITNLICFSQSVYVDNALKFSLNEYGGTARFVGMGGAFGALGGDQSAIVINPAGLGVYRGSEFIFSPGMTYSSNSASYINNNSDEGSYFANISNAGFVASYDLNNSDTRWVNFNFGVTYNRTTDFNDNVQFRGINDNSLLELFVNTANQTSLDPEDLDGMYEYLIWDSYIMDLDTIANEYYTEITDAVINDPANFEIDQRKLIEREGSVSEFSFAFSGNYAHKLYIGASIGITRLRYDENLSHYESETAGLPIAFIDAYEFKEHSHTEGTGFNLKFGAIYKPLDFIRIGASIHLPTFYNLDQEFYNEALGYFETINPGFSRSQVQTYEYELNTPLRWTGSLGFQIGKIGLIGIDYEGVNYSKMELDDDFDEVNGVVQDNADIKEYYQNTHNIRVGAEFRYGPLYFRAGGRYSTTPYKDDPDLLNTDYEKITYAGGLGYRENNFFVDFAFSQTVSSYKMIAYQYEYNNAVASIDNKLNNFILTFGFKF